jgi:hypothetical protein
MKRNVFNLMISASLLLGMSGCGSDQLAPGQENPTPVAPTPDENGLVTLRFGVSNAGYEDGVPESRGAEAPVTFTQELGDGYVLESTLTSSPRTKAAGDPLREGTTVMIFTLDEDNKATGYQLQEMGADGVLNISVPAGVTPKLMLYTQDNDMVYNTGGQISQILSDVSDITNTAVGQYNALSPAVDLKDDGYLASLAQLTGNLLVNEGMIAIAGPINTSNLAAMNPRISFNHVFCRLTWNIEVDADADETIGLVRAGFYPRTASGDMLFKSYVNGSIQLSELFVPTFASYGGGGGVGPGPGSGTSDNQLPNYNPPGDNCFITSASWSPVAKFSQSVCFQRPAIWGSPRVMKIAIDSLTINNPTGNVTYQDQEITLTGPTSFEAGKEYTVNSRITKRLTWATSNIYWDGTKLTFDADAVNGGVANGIPSVTTANSPYYNGVLFQWGSLAGISPVGALGVNPTDLTVYWPITTASTGGYNSNYGVIENGWNLNLNGYYFDVPEDNMLPREAVMSRATGIWYGDICSYITQGVWHMPTKDEYGQIMAATEEEPTGEGWWFPSTGSWIGTAIPDDDTGNAGRSLVPANQVIKLKTKWGQVITLPSGIYRPPLGFCYGGEDCGYWYGTGITINEDPLVYGGEYAAIDDGQVGSYNDPTIAPGDTSHMTMALPVRCVK